MSSLTRWVIGLLGGFALLCAAASTLYVQDTTEHAVVTRFGEPVRIDEEAGLRFRFPLGIEKVQRISNRLHLLIPTEAEYLTKDKRNLTISCLLLWKVSDPLLFVRSVGDRDGAEARLSFVLSSEVGNALGNVEFSDILLTDEESGSMEQLTANLLSNCQQIASEEYGIEVADVQIRRIGFPDLNRTAVFERMRAERQRIAVKVRSEGEEQATLIRSEAELEKARILAEARREAEELRGQGEAEATRIYADAIRKDPDFYTFLRTLEAYEVILDDQTTVVLPADSELLDLLMEGP